MSLNQQKNYLFDQQVSLLKKSYRQMDGLKVASRFYEKLFEQHPHLKHLFPPDHHELMIKLVSVIELVVFSFEEKSPDRYMLQENMVIPLRDLGRKHDERGIKPEHYVMANNILIESIEEHLGKDFSEPVKESWKVALQILSTAMQDTSVDSEISNKVSDSLFSGNFRQLFNDLKKRMKQ